MTNSDIALKNSNRSHNLGAVSQDEGVGSGILRDPAEFNQSSCSSKILTKMSRMRTVIQPSDKIKR